MKVKLGKGGFWIVLRLTGMIVLFPVLVMLVIQYEIFDWLVYVLLIFMFGGLLLVANELIDNLEVVEKEDAV